MRSYLFESVAIFDHDPQEYSIKLLDAAKDRLVDRIVDMVERKDHPKVNVKTLWPPRLEKQTDDYVVCRGVRMRQSVQFEQFKSIVTFDVNVEGEPYVGPKSDVTADAVQRLTDQVLALGRALDELTIAVEELNANH